MSSRAALPLFPPQPSIVSATAIAINVKRVRCRKFGLSEMVFRKAGLFTVPILSGNYTILV